MPEEILIPPTSGGDIPADLSIRDLRKMLSASDTGAENGEPTSPAPVKPKEPVTPSESKEPEKSDAESGTAEEKEAEEPKSESAIDRRFSKLARQRDEARQDAERARQEAQSLRRELEAKSAPPGPAETKQKPDGRPVPPDPDTWTGDWASLRKAELKYTEDLADWKVSEALKARDQAEAQRRAEYDRQQTQSAWDKKLQATVAKNPEIMDAIDELGAAVTQAGIAELIKKSEVGTEIMLRLHRHREEFTGLLKLGDPLAMARQIGLIEAQITQQSSAPKPQPVPPPPKLQKPPVAMDGGGGPSEFDLDKEPYGRRWKREALRQTEGD